MAASRFSNGVAAATYPGPEVNYFPTDWKRSSRDIDGRGPSSERDAKRRRLERPYHPSRKAPVVTRRSRHDRPPRRPPPRLLFLVVALDANNDVVYKSPHLKENYRSLFTEELKSAFKIWYCNELDVS